MSNSIILVISLLVVFIHRKVCPFICVSPFIEATFKSCTKWPWWLPMARSAWVLAVSRACCVTQTSQSETSLRLAELSASVLPGTRVDPGRIGGISNILTVEVRAYFTTVEINFKRCCDDSSVHLWTLTVLEEQWAACPRLSSHSTVSLCGFAPRWTVTWKGYPELPFLSHPTALNY